MIVCRELSIEIGNEVVVKNLSLDVGDGELVLLTGASGSGKSLVLKAIAGILEMMYSGIKIRGSVNVDGCKPIDAARSRRVVYVPQDLEYSFLTWTLDQELKLLSSRLRDEVAEVLGLYTLARKPLDRLSAGERYRAIVGLALSMGVRVLLLDEPSTFLDRQTLIDFLNLVKQLARSEGLSVLIADHRVDVLRSFVDEVVYLEFSTQCNVAKIPTIARPARISLRDVWFRYGRREPYVLRSLSIDIEGGDVIAFVGRNAVGKTTTLRLALGIVKPVKGFIERVYRRAFYVPQNPVYWFTQRTLEDEAKAVKASSKAIDFAGLEEKRLRPPYALSVGEARRFSIYLAAYSGRELVVIDEPTLGMDLESCYCLKELVDEMSRAGIAVVMATHDKEFTQFVKARTIALG